MLHTRTAGLGPAERTTRLTPLLASLTSLLALLASSPGRAQLGEAGDRLITAEDLPSVVTSPEARLGSALAQGDFDGDGAEDLAIGLPGRDQNAGQVVVVYSPGSSGAPDDEVWDQDSLSTAGGSEPGDRFGNAVASGDFDGDGYDDLAIGAADEMIAGLTKAGVVHVLYGSADGLLLGTAETLDGSAASGTTQASARFGVALAAGDFDDDGRDDLAIGARGERVGLAAQAGAVVVVYGADGGLDLETAERWTQDNLGAATGLDEAEAGDGFGWAFATGDFDGNGFDDLAVGAPLEDRQDQEDVGALHLIHGHAEGLRAVGSQFLLADASVRQENSRFARALAAGDFDGDGLADLAAGIPAYDFSGERDAGLVYLLFSAPGLGPQPSSFLVRGQANAGETPEDFDRAAAALAAGDFDCDGDDDLVFGAPGEDVSTESGSAAGAGAIGVLPGDPLRLMSQGQTWHQHSPGLGGAAEMLDEFGSSLAAIGFGGPCGGVAVGVPGESTLTASSSGAVHLILGTSRTFHDGFESGGLDAWSAASP